MGEKLGFLALVIALSAYLASVRLAILGSMENKTDTVKNGKYFHLYQQICLWFSRDYFYHMIYLLRILTKLKGYRNYLSGRLRYIFLLWLS